MNRAFQISKIFSSLTQPKKSKRRRSSNKFHTFSQLEARQLLASVSFDTVGFGDHLQFTADSGMADTVSVETTETGALQFRVGNGDSISVSGNVASNPAIQLSSFATNNDTLTIDPTGNFGSGFARLNVVTVDLGDAADTLSIDVDTNDFIFNDTLALFFDGGSGNDQIDASDSTKAVRIDGGLGSDRIIGGSGNDTILGDSTNQDRGNDVLFGGAGNDFLSGSGGADELNGGIGNDILLGGEGVDEINGGLGIDTNSFVGIGDSVAAIAQDNGTGSVEHGFVRETFTGIEGFAASAHGDELTLEGDTDGILVGGAGDDILTGGAGNDRIYGNDGDDILRAGPGEDIVFGGNGNDTLNGGADDDELYGGADDDFIVGIGGTDLVNGGTGIDTNSFQGAGSGVIATIFDDGSGTVSYGTVDETFAAIENLIGTEFDDTLTVSGNLSRTLQGLAGDDTLIGGEGDDTLIGAEGNDVLRGRGGDDILQGNAGDDRLNGNDGDDMLFGHAGDDFFVGIGGVDSIHGGAGIDTNSFQGINTGVTATINESFSGVATHGTVREVFTGIENLTGSDFDDVLSVFTGIDTIVRGRGGNDTITSAAGNDRLIGGIGNDILRSGAGNDVSLGGFGNDTLNGGGGNDMLFGEEGDDFFVGIAGLDFIAGGEGFDLNSFEGIDASVIVNRNDEGSGTARIGGVLETFTGIDAIVKATVDNLI